MSTLHRSPDPVGLAIAREIQDRLRPAEVILFGSRADGSHSPGSDVDLIAIAPDEAAANRAKETVREIPEGRRGMREVSVITTTREEFDRTALLGQSFAGQAARYGVTPEGQSLGYRPERDPSAGEIRELTIWWLRMAERHLNTLKHFLEDPCLHDSELWGIQAQWGLERSFKGLLAADNDTVRFRRDAALMWRHIKENRPITDEKGAEAVENLLAATVRRDGSGCSLTRFTEARRRGDFASDPQEAERQAMTLHLAPAVNALVTEALARSGATRGSYSRNESAAESLAGKLPGNGGTEGR